MTNLSHGAVWHTTPHRAHVSSTNRSFHCPLGKSALTLYCNQPSPVGDEQVPQTLGRFELLVSKLRFCLRTGLAELNVKASLHSGHLHGECLEAEQTDSDGLLLVRLFGTREPR